MSARPLAIVSLFSLATLLSGSEGPTSKREGTKAGTVRTVKVIAPLPGVIDFIGTATRPLAIGDRIAKGQILVQLDNIRAKIDRLAKRFDRAPLLEAAQYLEKEWERQVIVTRRLFELGAIARADLDAKIATYHRYRDEAADLRKAQEVAQAGPKEGPTPLERAELAVEMHCLKSPINGVVRSIYKTRGEGVKASEAILLIEEIGK